jgi:CRP/FNR family transcriptional regulator, cyclic AMP receptor protein
VACPEPDVAFICDNGGAALIDPTNKIRDILRARSVFAGLNDAALDGIIQLAKATKFAKGDAIFQRGSPADSLLVILSGRVKISNIASSSREVVLNFLAAGDLTGEFGALDGEARSADATALEATEALVIYRRDILAFLSKHPDALLAIVTTLTRKLRMMSAMAEHNLLQMPGKAASGLLRLVEQHGRESKDGIVVDLKLSQRDLGNYVGLSRENTSRELGRLREAGVIRIEGATIIVQDVDALRDHAEFEAD